MTWVTTYFSNQSALDGPVGGDQYCWKQSIVLLAGSGSTGAPALWSQAAIDGVELAYAMPICSPCSVVIDVRRMWLNAGQVSEPGTRLGSSAPPKVTAGRVTAAVALLPVCTIVLSHNDGLVVSPGSGKVWVRPYVSTALYVPAELTLV